MIDAVLLLLVLAVAGATGLFGLGAVNALPEEPADRLLVGLATGLGVVAMVGLGLAALGLLTPWALAGAGLILMGLGGRALVDALASAARSRRAWPWAGLLVCAGVLGAEVVVMMAPPIGGDQTKYQLVYPRLYALAGGLVETRWSFWGHMQYLQNFLFAIGFALRGDVLARFLNGTFGVLATLALASLARHHLGRRAGPAVGVLFFTLPISWSLMTRAGSDFPVVLYTALGLSAVLEWGRRGAASDLRRAAVMAGLAGGCKVMAFVAPAIIGLGVLVVGLRRAVPAARLAVAAASFGCLTLVVMSPWYVRNAVDTGNPIYPFAYDLFGGRDWSADAGAYLDEYYRGYQSTWAARRDALAPYAGADVVRFPWDLTMHPESFEKGARQSLDIGPLVLAFLPGVALVRRCRPAVLITAGMGLLYTAIIAVGAWAHPRYVLPGVTLLFVAAVPAAMAVVGRRAFGAVVALSVVLNLAVTARLLRPLWPDQLRVALGRLAPAAFLRRHEDRFVFWERANTAVPPDGKVLVLEKIPHPYYIDRPFVLGSYLEQALLDYRTLDTPEALAGAAKLMGVTHVAVDMDGLRAAGDPFEARVVETWRGFLGEECDVVLRAGGFGLYTLKSGRALAGAVS